MRSSFARIVPLLAVPFAGAQLFSACSSNHAVAPSGSTTTGAGGAGGAGGSGGAGTGGTGGTGGSAPDPKAACTTLGLTSRPWSAGPYGTHRGDVADDFTVPLVDMTTWSLKQSFSGCESYVFVPDTLAVSQSDSTSIWASSTGQADLTSLVKQSPRNVHYFFVSGLASDKAAAASLQAQAGRVATTLGKLSASDAAWWKDRLHVVARRAGALDGWLAGVFATHGQAGFSIDRLQRIRGAGDLSDVTRQIANAPANSWPFERNLAYVAHYAQYYNAENDLQTRLDAENATVVPLWKGDVLMQQATTTVALPDATTMAGFDTLEVEVTQQCPDPDAVEMAQNNCGAWDYIANLNLFDDFKNPVEIARFITSYHRETHWVEDISQMLPLLSTGGLHDFLWSFAPPWNTQPTASFLSLRFSNKGKGMRPTQATFLFSGGNFDSMYNVGRMPVAVPIPASAKKVELWVIVTGHGSGTNQCSEFCDHQHQFTVNGTQYLKDFPLAGTEDKCIPNVAHGMTPNQAGTWWYGRGGWCPGQQVDPWVTDVTADAPAGQTATVSYRGLFAGVDPPPDGSGNIDLVSYLVVHE